MGIPKVMNSESLSFDRSPFVTELSNKNSDAIVFPSDDDNEIDLSGSFRPSSFKPLTLNLDALCSASLQLRMQLNLDANATSGIYTFPNGTRVQYAQCKVVVVVHPT
jgi:hypothetical protein